jgi:hypothetical protein
LPSLAMGIPVAVLNCVLFFFCADRRAVLQMSIFAINNSLGLICKAILDVLRARITAAAMLLSTTFARYLVF